MSNNKVRYERPHCNSEEIPRDVYVSWNVDSQQWELENVFDYTIYNKCEREVSPTEKPAD